MTKRLSDNEKVGRRPASRACVFCHSKHLQCNNERPCRNCVKRNIAHQCTDKQRKRAKYLKPSGHAPGKVAGSAMSSAEPEPPSSQSMRVQQTQFVPLHPRPVKLEQPPVPPVRMLNTTNDVLNRISTSTKDAWLDLSSQLDSTIGFDAADNLDAFSSNYLNQEYMMLGDILLHSKPTSPSPSTSSEVMGPPMQVQFDADLQQPRRKRKNNSARPFISLGFPKENQNVTRDENPKIPGSLFDAGLDNPASITNGANQIMQHQPPNLIPYE